jgi:hypothetical protein
MKTNSFELSEFKAKLEIDIGGQWVNAAYKLENDGLGYYGMWIDLNRRLL